MDIAYDPIADAFNIVFKRGNVSHTKEVSDGVLLDIDKNGTPLYLEILNASKRFKKSKKLLQRRMIRLSSRPLKFFNHARKKTKATA